MANQGLGRDRQLTLRQVQTGVAGLGFFLLITHGAWARYTSMAKLQRPWSVSYRAPFPWSRLRKSTRSYDRQLKMFCKREALRVLPERRTT